jgi:hypothetical protein
MHSENKVVRNMYHNGSATTNRQFYENEWLSTKAEDVFPCYDPYANRIHKSDLRFS